MNNDTIFVAVVNPSASVLQRTHEAQPVREIQHAASGWPGQRDSPEGNALDLVSAVGFPSDEWP